MLEPIYLFTITVPEVAGDAMGQLKTKCAHILGIDNVANKTVLTVHAPLAEMQLQIAKMMFDVLLAKRKRISNL